MSSSVAKALDIVETLGKSDNGCNLVELSNLVGIPHPTVHRLLQTLKDKGFVTQERSTGAYYLSGKFLRLQTTIFTKRSLILPAIPVLNRLAQALPCHAHLGVLTENQVVYIESRRTNPFVTEYLPTGRTGFVHATALGKAIAAFLPREERARLVATLPLEKFTDNTIVDRQTLSLDLDAICARGYAIDNQENRLGNRCIAAPVREHTDAVIAAISVSLAIAQLPDSSLTTVADLVVEGANEISRALGWGG